MYYLQHQAEDASCISDTTPTRMFQMASKTFQFYRTRYLQSDFENTSLYDQKIKVKVYENQQNSLSGCTDSFTLIISFVFFMNY